jgi:hypothetical protein
LAHERGHPATDRRIRRPEVRPPNVVVFVDSCNDVMTPPVFRGDVKIPLHFEKDWLDYFALIQEGGFYYFTASNARTLGQRLYKRAFGENRFPAPPEPDLLGKHIVDNYLTNIRVVDGLSRSFGFKYDFFWLPLFFDDLPPIFKDALRQTVPLIKGQQERTPARSQRQLRHRRGLRRLPSVASRHAHCGEENLRRDQG